MSKSPPPTMGHSRSPQPLHKLRYIQAYIHHLQKRSEDQVLVTRLGSSRHAHSVSNVENSLPGIRDTRVSESDNFDQYVSVGRVHSRKPHEPIRQNEMISGKKCYMTQTRFKTRSFLPSHANSCLRTRSPTKTCFDLPSAAKPYLHCGAPTRPKTRGKRKESGAEIGRYTRLVRVTSDLLVKDVLRGWESAGTEYD